MRVLTLGSFSISTYILMIGVAFLTSFIVFYKISKKEYDKIDVAYIYVINIVGFAIGSKLMSLISNNINFSIYNFLNSGYSFLGGIIGSILVVALYCRKYKLDFINILSYFAIIYPLIYSISKIGCFFSGCCYGTINVNNIDCKFPFQLIDSAIMLILFLVLLVASSKKKTLTLGIFFCTFSVIRFFEDYFREVRNVILYGFTAEQILCTILIFASIFVIISRVYKTYKN